MNYEQFEGHTPKPWIPLRADVEEHDIACDMAVDEMREREVFGDE